MSIRNKVAKIHNKLFKNAPLIIQIRNKVSHETKYSNSIHNNVALDALQNVI